MIPYSYDSTTVPRTDVEYPSAYSLFRGDMLQCRQNKPATSPSKLLPTLQFLIVTFQMGFISRYNNHRPAHSQPVNLLTQTNQNSIV